MKLRPAQNDLRAPGSKAVRYIIGAGILLLALMLFSHVSCQLLGLCPTWLAPLKRLGYWQMLGISTGLTFALLALRALMLPFLNRRRTNTEPESLQEGETGFSSDIFEMIDRTLAGRSDGARESEMSGELPVDSDSDVVRNWSPVFVSSPTDPESGSRIGLDEVTPGQSAGWGSMASSSGESEGPGLVFGREVGGLIRNQSGNASGWQELCRHLSEEERRHLRSFFDDHLFNATPPFPDKGMLPDNRGVV